MTERPRLVIRTEPSGIDLRARQEAVRAARARFERVRAELEEAGDDVPEEESAAMDRLEQAARELRQAEAALDRARRRQP